MLPSLYVKNYRNLKELKIDSLASVNLFTGKNNTGKSSILEAIAIYASNGDWSVIDEILVERGESSSLNRSNSYSIETQIQTISSLFNNREVSFRHDKAILIGWVADTLFGEEVHQTESCSLRIVKYVEDDAPDDKSRFSIKRTIVEEENPFVISHTGLQLRFRERSIIVPLNRERLPRLAFTSSGERMNFEFIRTRNIERDGNGKLWDKIALTKKEEFVIAALKIIEPTTERIAFIEASQGERIAVIKTASSSGIVPLRSLGDGINRVLTIILAMVSCDNGYLLLDEFENGLHYSVQEQLWKVIFDLSARLNIQVFATTHSSDCIAAFQKVLNSSGNQVPGKLIRLDNKSGTIKQVQFSAEELKMAYDSDIEIR